MRIVAGEARGRKLVVPPGKAVRPTPDRVREAVGNALFSLGDLVAGARVVDLFAGSGALGLEALSRGAAHATFFDTSAAARAAVAANLAALGFTARGEVVDRDALAWAGRLDPAGEPPFDLAFADPPYAFDRWSELLAAPLARWVVVESDREVAVPADRWGLARSRRYGTTVVQIIQWLT